MASVLWYVKAGLAGVVAVAIISRIPMVRRLVLPGAAADAAATPSALGAGNLG